MNKSDFPIFENNSGLIYLDSAASAQKPAKVLEQMDKFARHYYSNVHRGTYYLSEMSTIAYENARHTVADFLSVSDNDIIFVRGATEGINLVAQTYGRTLERGDKILVSEAEHHSNLIPWQILSQEKGIELEFITVMPDGRLNMDDFLSKLSEQVKLVAVTQMSNVLGVENPVQSIVHLSHQVGAKVLIDGCQGIVHNRINVSELGVDFYVFSGHKIYGPTGIGVLCASSDLMDTLPPWQGGGDMVKSVSLSGSTYALSPARFEAGTPAIIEAIGLAGALDYVSSLDFEKVMLNENQTMKVLKDNLYSLDDVVILGDLDLKKSLVCFNLKGLHPQDVAMILSEQNVAVRVGHHCAQPITEKYGVTASIRASIGLYNDEEDIFKFMDALKRARKILGGNRCLKN